MIDLGGCEWALYVVVGLAVLRLIGLGIGGSSGNDDNDELNRVTKAWQDEALANLTSPNPTYTAKAAYDAFIAAKRKS